MLNWTVKGTANTRYRTLITQVVNFSSVNFWACLNQSLSNLWKALNSKQFSHPVKVFPLQHCLGLQDNSPIDRSQKGHSMGSSIHKNIHILWAGCVVLSMLDHRCIFREPCGNLHQHHEASRIREHRAT